METQQENALVALGSYITGQEAKGMADRLIKGLTLTQAISCVPKPRQQEIRAMLVCAGFECTDIDGRTRLSRVLRAVQGAWEGVDEVHPIWTAPKGIVHLGDLNSSRNHLLKHAEKSIVCSTYNFQRSSKLWEALKEKAQESPQIQVRIYLDAEANTANPYRHYLDDHSTAEDIAREFPRACIFRTRKSGKHRRYRNHAKFISIDSQYLLVTSANFSFSAEELNIELGLQVNDSRIAKEVERQMREFESILYERVLIE